MVAVLERGWTAVGAGPGRDRALRRQAVELLITAQWLIGEAASRGIAITGLEVRREIDIIEHVDFLGGLRELREFVKPTGQTVADVELHAKVEIARAKLRQLAIAMGSAWRAHWTAATDCTDGYVVPGCRQYGRSSAGQSTL